MGNIKHWCSNKENIKILIMIGMAIILLVILKIRFSGKTVQTSDLSAAGYETGAESITQDSEREYIKRIPETAPARSKKLMFRGLKPPPFLFATNSPMRDSIKPGPLRSSAERVRLDVPANCWPGARERGAERATRSESTYG